MSAATSRVWAVTDPLDPDEYAELKRRVSRLRVDEAETRWLALHLDLDVQAMAENVKNLRDDVGNLADAVGTIAQAVSAVAASLDRIDARANERLDKVDATLAALEGRFDSNDAKQVALEGRFDSTDAQLRSLTMMVGQALRERSQDVAGDDAEEPESR